MADLSPLCSAVTPATTQPAKQPKLTDPQKIQSLRAMAGKLLEERTPFADRVPLLRARAQELDITLRDGELNRLIWDARRAAAGAVDGLGPGDLINLAPTPWHWESVLMPESLNLLVALPKVGKTSLMLAMIAAWNRGEGSFLGLPLYGPCPPVLIVGTDQPDNDWGRMLLEVGLLPDGKVSAPIVRLFHRGSPLHLSPEGIEAIAVYAASHPKLFVLLDSVAALTSPLGLDENSAEIVEPINDLLEALEPHGATVVAIHHASKGRAGESATLASRGSTALPAAASQIISLGGVATGRPGEAQDRRLVLKTEGRAGMPQHLLIERTEDGWISHGSADAVALAQRMQEVEEKLTDRQAEALELVRERWSNGERTDAKVLAAALRLKGSAAERTSRRTLDALAHKGCLRSVNEATQHGRTKWWWPVEGDRTPSRGVLSDVSQLSEVSDPLKDQEEGSYRSKEGKDTSDRKDTQETPPREGVRTSHMPRPVRVDGTPGWHLPAPLPSSGGPSTCVLVVDPVGQSQRIERWRITPA
ncbi:MAG: AAA family ATPase [Cyanobacteriota bacterium]|jgi:hypothetical protein